MVVDRARELSAWLSTSRARCGPSSASLRVAFQSREILSIEPVGSAGPAERCYRAALWGLRLDEEEAVTADAYLPRGSVLVPLPGEAPARR